MSKVKFFKIIVHSSEKIGDLYGLCAGFENKKWRKEQLVNYILNYIPEFALPYSEYISINHENTIEMTRTAFHNIYKTDKYQSRGELGELLLHCVLKDVNNTIPAISKIYYKDSANDTVKGFDSVHVINKGKELELWLGEVKFYSNINSAINDVTKELEEHTKTDFLRGEFLAITNKIDKEWPHKDKLIKLLDPNTSLDEIFDRACVPVLLTYDSKVISKYESHCKEYLRDIEDEFRCLYNTFAKKISDKIPLTVHLYLIPLKTKKDLVEHFNEKVKSWQQI